MNKMNYRKENKTEFEIKFIVLIVEFVLEPNLLVLIDEDLFLD